MYNIVVCICVRSHFTRTDVYSNSMANRMLAACGAPHLTKDAMAMDITFHFTCIHHVAGLPASLQLRIAVLCAT